MTKIECKCHLTQRLGSMLLGFQAVAICHGMKMKSCNFMMLGSNHRISTSVRERKELEYASLRWYKRLLFTLSLLCICGDVAVLGCVPIWEFAYRLCHVLFLLVTPSAEARRCMRVLLVSCFSSNCH